MFKTFFSFIELTIFKEYNLICFHICMYLLSDHQYQDSEDIHHPQKLSGTLLQSVSPMVISSLTLSSGNQ